MISEKRATEILVAAKKEAKTKGPISISEFGESEFVKNLTREEAYCLGSMLALDAVEKRDFNEENEEKNEKE